MTSRPVRDDGFNAILELTEPERTVIGKLIDELAGAEPRLVDRPEWMAVARAASCRLPVRLLETLREFRHDPGGEGSLLLRNLPVDDAALPSTPTEPESVERNATGPAGTIVSVMLQLGEIIAFREEKRGALVHNVVPVPGKEEFQGNAGSTTLEMHVENAFHPNRPDYVGLFCLRADHDRTARLCVYPVRQAIRHLGERTLQVLGEPRFRTEAPPSFGDRVGRPDQQPVLHGDLTDPDVVVDFHSTHAADEDAASALTELRSALESVMRPVLLEPGDLAIVDNRVALHGRTAFRPRYDGADRWLHRTFVHLDHRRSRARRPGNALVLA